MALVKIPLADRFWSKVHKTEGCWLWQAQTNNKGYGCFIYYSKRLKRPSRNMYAHRVSWTLTYGEIPDGMNVLHKCDTPACVRPDHLFLGTQLENIQDAHRKGRMRKPPRSKQKLTPDQVRAIRSDSRSLAKIAAAYGVTRSAIWPIKVRRTWKHLE